LAKVVKRVGFFVIKIWNSVAEKFHAPSGILCLDAESTTDWNPLHSTCGGDVSIVEKLRK
jgi:hypothetical protein